ncbi:MAG: hypothetical protein U0800_21330 [Isosphaeraceae bacterium]
MGFLDRLLRATASKPEAAAPLDDSAADPASEVTLADNAASEYDRAIWRKKLKTSLERLPESADEWPNLLTEATALGFGGAWVQECLRTEFELLVRKIVSDRVVSPEEHAKLDQARQLIGLGEIEAIALVDKVVADAESFFGRKVDQG